MIKHTLHVFVLKALWFRPVRWSDLLREIDRAPGVLAPVINSLIEDGYITRIVIGTKHTEYKITEEGREAYMAYLEELRP